VTEVGTILNALKGESDKAEARKNMSFIVSVLNDF
jgi:hypothetical protein